MARTAAEVQPLVALSLLLLLLSAGAGRRHDARGRGAAERAGPLRTLQRAGRSAAPRWGLYVSRDCACGTLGIITSLPPKCGLPPISCQ
ncbi:anther-specific protein MZm3-3-like [Phragmites australis]|uniref:anther-specific protein MZm3-3-like n=1 Tax=Phragmites australis TaxID=29695 RepID=UPI002D78C1D7|nr:anther-specific protein MZm3-3-like [Phragmites australis]